MPARGEIDDYDEEDGNQYDDQVAAYPLEVTVTIEQDVKEKVFEIYQTIRSEHGQENEVLCQTGIQTAICVHEFESSHFSSISFVLYSSRDAAHSCIYD